MTRELLQQALDALDAITDKIDGTGFSSSNEFSHCLDTIDALRSALAQPEAEPVAWLCENAVGHKYFRWKKPMGKYKPTPLYAAPPAAPAVPLTNEQVLPAFDAWKERYGLRYEPNWSKEIETDCLAAFEAGIAAGQLALLSRTVVKRKPLTNAQIIDATAQIDYSENGYVIRLARAIEKAHGIGGGGNG